MRTLDRRAALKTAAASLAYAASVSIACAEPIRLKRGEAAISQFPDNRLGNDKDMISQLRSGARELATPPNTVTSTLAPQLLQKYAGDIG